MKRADALERWRRIAAGDLQRPRYDAVDLAEWIESVARLVVSADGTPDSKQRPYDLIKALGLNDRMEPYPEVRRELEVWNAFEDPTDWKRGDRNKIMVQVARAVRPDWHGFTDEEVLKKAKRASGER